MGVVIEFKPVYSIDAFSYKRYKEYLQSSEWKEKRLKVIERARGCCEECGADVGSHGEVHHEDYESLYKEAIDDLTYLCADCHEATR